MKIDDYDFHKKFQYLIKWCKPGVKYSLNERGLIEYNKFRTLHGYWEISLTAMNNHYWFYIEGGESVTRFGKHKIDKITDLGGIAFSYPFLSGGAFAELIFDTDNLVEL